MKKIRFHLDFSLPRLSLNGWLAGMIVVLCVPELGSENVTLTTYYPAPSGIYAQMITTGNTYLARDPGGVVGIQTTTPGASLEVAGSGAKFSGLLAVEPHADANVYAGIFNTTPRIIFGGGTTHEIDNSAGAMRFFRPGVTDMLIDPAGRTAIGGAVTAVGANFQLTVGGGGAIQNTQLNCSVYRYTGGTNTLCGSGPLVAGPGSCNASGTDCYATAISGIWSEYSASGGAPILQPPYGSGEFLCCPCGAGGCP